jgi:hypothetical protein
LNGGLIFGIAFPDEPAESKLLDLPQLSLGDLRVAVFLDHDQLHGPPGDRLS